MNPETLTELQDVNLRNLLKTGAFQFIDTETPWFPYTSGQVGPYYVQSTTIEKDGAAYATAVESMVQIIHAEFPAVDVIAGGETRDWDFSNPVAVALRLPHFKMYKDGKVLGADIDNKRVLHVADLNNEGSSVRDHWKPMIEKHGGRLVGVLCFVDRLEDGVSVIRGLGVKLISVVPLDEHAWKIALDEGVVSRPIFESLVERSRDKKEWATRSLRSHPDYFRKLYQDPKTHDKTVKIMNTYPDIRDELNRMVSHP